MGQLQSIQQLRGLAALAVVLFHYSAVVGWEWTVGQAGVDVFFVVSGFIMWMVTEKPTTPAKFAWDRAARIVPIYWLATMIMATWNGSRPGAIITSLLFIPYERSPGVPYPILAPGWTLNLEMFFYGLFAATLFLPRRAQLWTLTATFGALTLAGWLFHLPGPVWGAYTNPIIAEFIAGAWLCVAWRKGLLPSPRTAVGLVLAAVATLAVVDASGAYSEPVRPLVWGLPALAVVAALLGLERAGKAPLWLPLKHLGDASYSLYLFHMPVLYVVRLFVPEGWGLFIASVPASIAVGLLSFHLLEKPIGRALKSGLVRLGPQTA